jgi:hypothetical protein
MTFLKRLLGIAKNSVASMPPHLTDAKPTGPTASASPSSLGVSASSVDVMNRYFELSMEIEAGKRDRDFPRAIRAARATYQILPAVVTKWKREYGSFDIRTSHAVHTAPKLMAVMEVHEGLAELRTVLELLKELRGWLPAADEAEADVKMVPQIILLVGAEPGILQSALKSRVVSQTVSEGAGSGASNLAAWLEKAGRIQRVKKGSSYQLYPAGYRIPSASPSAASRASNTPLSGSSSTAPSSSHQALPSPSFSLLGSPPLPRAKSRRAAAKARLLDFAGLRVVRLPQAPPSWEERAAREVGVEETIKPAGKRGAPKFTVEAPGWSITAEEKLAPADRPDPAFKEVFPTGCFTHWLDRKGKREGFETAASVLRVTDRRGQMVAERGIVHDVYRADVNSNGTGILFLSRDGMVHGYTNSLEPFVEERLADLPEYQAQANRLGIEPHALKDHTRCVAISSDRSRYLVTVVDEAWCLDTATGDVLWGLRMPSKEGWTRVVADRSERAGSSAEVKGALSLMELEMPVTPDSITKQYRLLAMRWHPDRNPTDPKATARFQELSAAMELLTGADLSNLSGRDVERVTYEQVLSQSRVSVPDGRAGAVDVNLTFSMGMSETFASDWIYAANMGKDGRAFLAGYSGKVVVISPTGIAERVYDIGAVPRRIVDAGEYVYIVTDTRLYVLVGDGLEALVDVYGASEVVVADRGFALLEPKALTWFTPSGVRVGTVRSNDPVRRVISTSTELIVETRQQRAFITGAPGWWN